MDYSSIKYDINAKGVAVITLNRPEVANAANITLCDEFTDAIIRATTDEKVRIIVITGAGKAFSAGGDIKLILDSKEPLEKKLISESVNNAVKAANNCPKPIIAAVNGVVGGGGICFVILCDLVFSAHDAKFTCNFLNIAACPDGGATFYLPRKMGYDYAFEILMEGTAFSAEDAEKYGLVNHVVPRENLWEHVMSVANRLASGPQNAQKLTKWLLKESLKNDINTQLELESFAQLVVWSSEDFKIGTQAFFEKRKPEFL